MAIGPDGTAYLTSIPGELVIPNTTLAPRTWIVVNRSLDGGRSWSKPTTVAPNDGSFWDKDAVTPDPDRPGVVYDAFIKSDQANGSAGYVATSHNRGETFAPPAENFPDQQLEYIHDPELVALADGTLVEVFVLFNGSEELPAADQVPVTMESMRSTDGGLHWSSPVVIAQAPNAVPYEPDSGQQIDALVWPSVAAGPDGTVYASWQSNTSAHSGEIEIASSADDGRSWSVPAPVALVPAQAWQPTVAIDRDGTVGVTWYDARNDRPGDGQFTTDVWFAASRYGDSLWQQVHLAGPFDFLRAGQRNGRPFIGDYQGLVPTSDGFAAVFAQAPPQSGHDHSAIFFARIALNPRPSCSSPSPRRRLRLRVHPSSVSAGRKQKLTFTIAAGTGRHIRPLRGATIWFAGWRLHTNRRGQATLTTTLRHPGRVVARATDCGYRAAVSWIRVI